MSLFKGNKQSLDKLSKRITESTAHINFSKETKIRSKARLFSLMSQHARYQTPYALKKIHSFAWLKKSIATLAIITVVGIGSYAGIAKADESKPGDALFRLDMLIESIQLAAARSPEAKFNVRVSIAEERLQELNDLTETFSTVSLESDTNTPASTNSTTTSSDKQSKLSDQDDKLTSAITQALQEVDGAIAKLKDESLKIKVKNDDGDDITNHQSTTFLNHVDRIVSQENIIIEKLDVKVKNHKLELKVKYEKTKNKKEQENHQEDKTFTDNQEHLIPPTEDNEAVFDEDFEGFIDGIDIVSKVLILKNRIPLVITNSTQIDTRSDVTTLEEIEQLLDQNIPIRVEGEMNKENEVSNIKFEIDKKQSDSKKDDTDEIRNNEQTNDRQNNNESNNRGREDEHVETEGTVTALSTSSITVNGLTFVINKETEIDLDDDLLLDDLIIGTVVEVEGYTDDGVLIAEEVKN